MIIFSEIFNGMFLRFYKHSNGCYLRDYSWNREISRLKFIGLRPFMILLQKLDIFENQA